MNPIYSVKQFRLLVSQVKLEREDTRIKLTLPYDPTYIKKIKTIPGYYWHPHKKYWSSPYSEDIFKKILSLFDGENIQVDTSPRVVHKRSSSVILSCRKCFYNKEVVINEKG